MGLLDKLLRRNKEDTPAGAETQPDAGTVAPRFSAEEFARSQSIYIRNLRNVSIFELQPAATVSEAAQDTVAQTGSEPANNSDRAGEVKTTPDTLMLGEYIDMTEGALTLAVTLKQKYEPLLVRNNAFTISFSRHGESFFMDTKIIEASKVAADDSTDGEGLDLAEFGLSQTEIAAVNADVDSSASVDTSSELTPVKYIVQLILCNESKRHKRKHGRIAIKWKVYFQEKKNGQSDDTGGKSKLQESGGETSADIDTSAAVNKYAGYDAAITIDISEGGFKSTTDVFYEKNSIINCIVEVDDENTSSGELIGKIIHCYQISDIRQSYEMTVQFIAMDAEVREFLERSIEKVQPAPVNAEARVSVSDKGKEASIEIMPPENNGADLTYEDLCARLAGENITHGIDHDMLRSIALKPHYNLEYAIARCTPPKHGADAVLTFHVDMNPTFTPKIGEDGVADFKDIGIIQKVSKDEVLAEKVPATEGENGISVTGEVIEAIPGKDTQLPAGRNVEINEQDTALTAFTDGFVSVADGKINVFDTYVIEGDVQYTTGNIDHNGIVVVKGDVRSGFSVKASGDVIINGSIESATVRAGGTIVVQGGCVGEENIVESKGNVAVRFIEGGAFYISGSLTTSYILNAEVKCGDSVEMVAPGLIRNSHVMAKTTVNAKTVGGVHSGADRTIIEVGNDPVVLSQYDAIVKNLETIDRDLETIVTNVRTMTLKMHQHQLSKDNAKLLDAYKLRAQQLSTQRSSMVERYNALKEQIDLLGYGTVCVEDIAHEGLKVIIGPSEFVLQDTVKAAKFRRTREGVIIEPL